MRVGACSPLLLGHNPFRPRPTLPPPGAHGWFRVHSDGTVGPLLPVDRYVHGKTAAADVKVSVGAGNGRDDAEEEL